MNIEYVQRLSLAAYKAARLPGSFRPKIKSTSYYAYVIFGEAVTIHPISMRVKSFLGFIEVDGLEVNAWVDDPGSSCDPPEISDKPIGEFQSATLAVKAAVLEIVGDAINNALENVT